MNQPITHKGNWHVPTSNTASYVGIAIALLIVSTFLRNCINTYDGDSTRLHSSSRVTHPSNTNFSNLLTPSVNSGIISSRSINGQMNSYQFDVRTLGETHPPHLIFGPQPMYPVPLLASNTAGTVLLEFLVTADGRVDEIKVIDSSHPLFAQSAVARVSQWRYYPAEVNGVKIQQRVQLPLQFQPNAP